MSERVNFAERQKPVHEPVRDCPDASDVKVVVSQQRGPCCVQVLGIGL